MAVLARRGEAGALLAAVQVLVRHAKGAGKPGPREIHALRTMKSMIDKQRLLPIANASIFGPGHQREAARQLLVIAGSAGAHALYIAREGLKDASARPQWVQVFRETGAAGWASALDRPAAPRGPQRQRHRLHRGPAPCDARAPGPGARRRGREVPRASAASPDRARGHRSALGRASAQAAHGRARVRRGARAHRRRHGAPPDPRDRRGDAQRDRAAASP